MTSNKWSLFGPDHLRQVSLLLTKCQTGVCPYFRPYCKNAKWLGETDRWTTKETDTKTGRQTQHHAVIWGNGDLFFFLSFNVIFELRQTGADGLDRCRCAITGHTWRRHNLGRRYSDSRNLARTSCPVQSPKDSKQFFTEEFQAFTSGYQSPVSTDGEWKGKLKKRKLSLQSAYSFSFFSFFFIRSAQNTGARVKLGTERNKNKVSYRR